jgi:sugar lactone lactonase YvrE
MTTKFSFGLVAGALGLIVASGSASALPFNKGDVFASVASGNVQHYDKDLNLLETLNTGAGGFTTGMAFDDDGNLYVTNFSGSFVAKFNASDGSLAGTFGSGFSTPESMLFDGSGNAYVGNLGNGIVKLDSSGAVLDTDCGCRVDWIDLSADQHTMFYTDESGTIHRFDVDLDVALADFAVGGVYALRILQNGDVLAANSGNINRFNSAGVLQQSYDIAGHDAWFALNLDPDGTSFWSGDFGTANFHKFDIASGAVLASKNTGTGSTTLFGLAVAGEITVSNPPNPPKPPAVPEPATLALLGLGLVGLASLRRREARL